jgi:IS30 family transposase
LVTAVERKSKLVLVKRVPDRQGDLVAKAVVQLLRPYKQDVLTITTDNGKEFSQHMKISKKLKADVSFAHPYHAWERGLNENTNGLLRQYFPKKMNFQQIDDKSINHAMDRLNNRPRKTLGFATPNEVFFSDINIKSPVALMI